MAEMNQTQIKYARQRAEAIFSDKSKALEIKHNTKGVSLTIKERLDALMDGDFSIKEPSDYQGAHQWHYQVVFDAEKPAVFDRDSYEKDHKELKTAFNALMDELMLGDNQEALKLLKAFEVG